MHTISGSLEKASRAVAVALRLAPDSRFVIRSAARFFVHVGEPDKAHALLRGTVAARHDPWLAAAELAVATAASHHPRLTRVAKSMIADRNLSDHHVSELASALATLELSSGNSRTARKLFRRSLKDPTENSVAQADWASKKAAMEITGLMESPVPRLYEARAWHNFVKGDWSDSLVSAKAWLGDQPFSSRPASLASYLLTSILTDFDAAGELLRGALRPNPDDPTLLNNLAFTYINQGRLDDAQHVLSRIHGSDLDTETAVVVVATYGFLCFRMNQPDEGRRLYNLAISKAVARKYDRTAALAAIFLTREELRTDKARAIDAFDQARRLSKGLDFADVTMLMDSLKPEFTLA
jgi:tetratricopeptide (TPR) repeat protein